MNSEDKLYFKWSVNGKLVQESGPNQRGPGQSEYHHFPNEKKGIYNVCLQVIDSVNKCDTTICISHIRDCDSMELLDVKELSKAKFSLELFPNPALGTFRIQTSLSSVKEFDKVEVIDISGKTVLSYNNVQVNSKFNATSMNKGVYFVKVQSGDVTDVRKLLIQ